MTIGYCQNCNKNVYTKREDINIGLLIVLCIFTGGFGAFIYLIVYYSKDPNRCIYCGAIIHNYVKDSHELIDHSSHSHQDLNLPNYQHKTKSQANYCPNCGSRLNENEESEDKPNFCPYCGVKISNRNKEFKTEKACIICHQNIYSSEEIIKCPYCGSVFHYECASKWLSDYNSCPMCQNQFINPDLPIIKN